MLGNILLRKLTRYSRNNTSIRNRSNRIWSRVWSGARDGSRLLLDQLHSWGFSISYDKASLFEQSVLHKEILLLITVNTAQTMLIPTLTSPMNPTHFTEWVLSADQRPNQCAKNRNPDSTAGQDYDLWSRRSKRDHNGSACSISDPNPFERLKSLMSSVYYSEFQLRSTCMIQRTLSPTSDWTNWSGYI